MREEDPGNPSYRRGCADERQVSGSEFRFGEGKISGWISAAFGLVTFALNRRKLMGAIGITLTLLALWGGGASVQVGPRYAAPGYIGLDWFSLDLMISR